MERATGIVLELLAKGSSVSEVAELTGNTTSAVSQVKAKYHEQIVAKQADADLAQGSHGSKLDKLESLLTNKLIGMVAMETDSMKVMNMLKTVNGAVRRDAGEAGGSGGNTINNTQNNVKVVSLQVPEHLRKEITVTTNNHNDVVAVGGRDLTPASMNSINQLAGLSIDEEETAKARERAFDEVMQSAAIPHLS